MAMKRATMAKTAMTLLDMRLLEKSSIPRSCRLAASGCQASVWRCAMEGRNEDMIPTMARTLPPMLTNAALPLSAGGEQQGGTLGGEA